MKIPAARKLPSGKWFIQLRLGGQSVPVTANTERECNRIATAIKAEYKAGMREMQPPAKLPTLGEAIDAYIDKRDVVLSPSTIRGYREIKKTRFKDLTDVTISDIVPAMWQTACNAEAALCSPKTLKNAWGFIASVLQENGITPPKVQLPQVVVKDRLFLEPEQIKPFMDAVHNTDVEIPALLALSSLRRSELLGLQWEQVDLKNRNLHIQGSAVFNEYNRLVQKPTNKNVTSVRIVPIMMQELYDALLAAQQPSGNVVVGDPNTIWKHINKICQQNNLPQVGFHGLRHSFVSLAYHLGISEKAVMEIGGWADFQTMRKIYTHLARSDVQRAAEQMTSFFNNANKNANSPTEALK